MKQTTPNEQTELAQELDANHLPVHKDVVAALLEWHDPKADPSDLVSRLTGLTQALIAHPLPKPPEPPLHEQVLAELGDGWDYKDSIKGYHLFRGPDGGSYWVQRHNPNTPAQIANALRVLAGEAGS